MKLKLKLRLLFVVVLVVVFTLPAFAGQTQRVKNTFNYLRGHCLSMQVARAQCRYLEGIPAGENYATNEFDNVLMKLFALPGKPLYVARKFWRNSPPHLIVAPHYRAAKKEYRKYLKEMATFFAVNNLNKEEQIKVILCSSANMIEYKTYHEKNDSLTDHHPYLILSRGYGMCRQFSTLAYHMSTHMDLPARRAYSNDHAYISYELGGRWFSAEPQSEECVFFPR